MQGASPRSFTLVLLVLAAAFVAPPATALAKPKPVKYALVSHTKGCLVTLNVKTGRLTFLAEKGHYGKFTVVVRHGKNKKTYHFTVKKPKPGQKLPTKPVVVPVSAPTGTPIVIIPVPIAGPAGPAGPPGTPAPIPSPPTTINPPAPPTPPRSAPHNFAPVLHVNGGVIFWGTDKGADTFHGAISTAPRNAAGRTTTYTVLGIVTSWRPATPPCGTTLYYGVASEGNAGEQWTANEVAIAGPKCAPPAVQNVAPTLTYGIGPVGDHEPALKWAQDPGATSFKAGICTDARGTSDRTCTYIDNIGNPGLPFGDGPGTGRMFWDLLGNGPGTADQIAPCGTHWFSIASEGPAGELWASAEYEFGGGFGLGIPRCPPPQVGAPATTPPVYSTLAFEQCFGAIDRINQEDGAPAYAGEGELSQLNPTTECQAMNELGPANSQTLKPVAEINKHHLCEDWATVINEYTDYISGWYVNPRTGDCDVLTTSGEYIEAFNASVSWASVDIVADYAHVAIYDHPLPWTVSVS